MEGCQRQTGSAFAINLLIERDRVEVTGEAEGVPAVEVFYDLDEPWPRESLQRIGR